MSIMEGLYQDIILDHYKHPRNFVQLDNIPDEQAHENPSCGDSLKMELIIQDGIIQGIHHESHGCAISVSSASMMSEFLAGKTVAQARQNIAEFLAAFRSQKEGSLEPYEDLVALEGVMKYPARVKCATLAWHAIEAMLQEK